MENHDDVFTVDFLCKWDENLSDDILISTVQEWADIIHVAGLLNDQYRSSAIPLSDTI